jgi:hypothetical protein
MTRIHLFGIRHHGPGSALALTRALDAVDPEAVLIEGPPEADAILPFAASPGMRPPLAILAYAQEDPSVATFYPLAEFSPEWQALRWALPRGRPVRFIDQPAATGLARALAAKGIEPDAAAGEEADEPPLAPDDPDPLATEIRADPIGFLGRLAGHAEGEGWWNELIEQGAPAPEIFAGIETMMTALRERAESADASPDPHRPDEAAREAQMRLAIAEAARAHPGPIAVVCGAWHVPALRRAIRPAEDRALLRDLPKTKTLVTFVPWTDTRLAAASGYRAGVASPGWYRHLWAEFQRAGDAPIDPRRLAAFWQARIGTLLRRHGLDAPTASIIEAARLAETLAALRGLSLPGLAEMRDAALATLCGGATAPFALIEAALVIGTEVGEIDDAVPQMPLQADLTRLQRKCRLKPSADEEELAVDLRTENGLARSTLLHRLDLIGVPWGRLQDAGRSRGSFRERWKLAWAPEFSVRLAEALVWGTTIAAAAAGRARALIGGSQDPKLLAETIGRALAADLPDLVDAAIIRLQAAAALTADLAPLIEAVPPLANLLRYGEARRVPVAELSSLLRHLCLEIAAGITRAGRALEPQAGQAMRDRVAAFERAVPLIDDTTVAAAWTEALGRLAEDEAVAPILRGHAARRLHERALVPPERTRRALSFALSRAVPPAEAGAWIDGFIGSDAEILIIDAKLLGLVDAWMAGLGEADFVLLLPLLRRVFGAFDRMQRRRLMEQVQAGPAPDMAEAAASDDTPPPGFARALPLLSLILGLEA